LSRRIDRRLSCFWLTFATQFEHLHGLKI
jgi:hypothetical protein